MISNFLAFCSVNKIKTNAKIQISWEKNKAMPSPERKGPCERHKVISGTCLLRSWVESSHITWDHFYCFLQYLKFKDAQPDFIFFEMLSCFTSSSHLRASAPSQLSMLDIFAARKPFLIAHKDTEQCVLQRPLVWSHLQHWLSPYNSLPALCRSHLQLHPFPQTRLPLPRAPFIHSDVWDPWADGLATILFVLFLFLTLCLHLFSGSQHSQLHGNSSCESSWLPVFISSMALSRSISLYNDLRTNFTPFFSL